jgi:hypothetical protein
LARRRLIVLAGVSVAAAAGVVAVAWAIFLRDPASPISVVAAVTSFRAETGAAGNAGKGPEPGVYVYRTSGYESTDALVGSRHAYPRETTIAVSEAGCGFVMRWQPLEGRSAVWEICPRRMLRRFTERHRFFGTQDVHDYRCDSETRAPPLDAAAGAAWGSRCSTGKTTETAHGVVVGLRAGLVHALERTRLTGGSRGTGEREWWLDRQTGLVKRLRIANDSVTDSAIGPVRYHEEADLVLTSPKPRR